MSGRLLRESVPFIGAAATNGQGFTCRNASVKLSVTPTAYVDCVSITTTLPQGLDDLNAVHTDHGFAGDHDGMADAGIGQDGAFLAKPFSRHELARKVHEQLDRVGDRLPASGQATSGSR